jgi:hypothetical protein
MKRRSVCPFAGCIVVWTPDPGLWWQNSLSPLRLLERGRTNGTAEQPARHTQTLNRKRLENFPEGAQLQLAMGQQFGNSESSRLPRGSINFESLSFHHCVPRDGVR